MPTDPNIILGINQDPGIHPDQLMSMFDFAQKVKQYKQQDETRNTLKRVFTDPNSIDQATGLLTPQANRAVLAVNPELGVRLQDASMEAQVKKAQLQHLQTEAGKTKWDFMAKAAGAGYDAYDAAKAAGKPEVDAIAAGQAARNTVAKNSGGAVGDDIVDGITGSPFDPAGAKALAGTNKDYASAADKRISLARQDQSEKERERHDSAMEANVARGQNIRVETGENNKWQVLTDPTHKDDKGNPTQYRYNPETGQSTTLDASQPYKPGGAQKIGSGAAAPRSMAAAAMQKYMSEHPNATDEDVTNFASDYGKKIKSNAAFSTGKQGDMLRSFNVSISHLNTLDNLVDALGNGDVKMLNKASNAFKEQFGQAAPANFNAAKSIVGDEIIKAIIGGGGALADRENAQNQIDRAESPQQLKGVIKTYKELMGGQLKGLKKQYEDTTGRKDFDDRLSPETKTELGLGGRPGTPKILKYDAQGNLVKG